MAAATAVSRRSSLYRRRGGCLRRATPTIALASAGLGLLVLIPVWIAADAAGRPPRASRADPRSRLRWGLPPGASRAPASVGRPAHRGGALKLATVMIGGRRDERPGDSGAPRRSRLTLGELANVWVDEPVAPFQMALAGQFDASPFLREDGTIHLRWIRAELVRRAGRVPAPRRHVICTRAGELPTAPPRRVDRPTNVRRAKPSRRARASCRPTSDGEPFSSVPFPEGSWPSRHRSQEEARRDDRR